MARGLAVVVRVPNGYGVMSRGEYESLPGPVRETVEVLAVSPSEEKARFVASHLPGGWREVTLAWREGDARAAEVVGVLRLEGVLR